MTSREGLPKKVRLACHRCRVRRIKCDGQFPACGNCSKAKVACIDVDGRNNEQLVPRNFVAKAKDRIRWLEDAIRLHLPNFDLSQGPQVDLAVTDNRADGAANSPDKPGSDPQLGSTVGEDALVHQSDTIPSERPEPGVSTKRDYSSITESDEVAVLNDQVRSIATDLGMLSLNTDSRQRHYLGSSSGLLFTRLIKAADDNNDVAAPPNPASIRAGSGSSRELAFERPGRFKSQVRGKKPIYHEVRKRLQQDLPSREDALFLFDVYFRQFHPDHPVIHRPSLINALDALYHCASLDEGAVVGQNGWPEDTAPFSYNGEHAAGHKNAATINIHTAAFHVFMVLNIAATARTQGRDFEFAPAQFYRAAMSVSRECFSEISLASLQAVLLLTIHTLIAPAEMNVWTLVHICMAHCIDIGLHREPPDIHPTARNVRRLVFHTVYSLDRSIATIQGRPLGIRDETFDVAMPVAERSQNEPDSTDAAADSLYYGTLPYSLHRFRLDRIVSEIKLLLYHLPTQLNSILWPSDMVNTQRRLFSDLKSWYDQIPTVVEQLVVEDETERRKWYIKLEIHYHATVVLLFQPSQVFNKPSQESLLLCFQSAIQQIQCHDALYAQNALYPGWRTIQCIFASATIIIYCFWTSKAVRSSQAVAGMPKIMRMCSNLLSIGGEWWPSVKRGKISFEKIVDVTLRKLNDLQVGTSETSAKRQIHDWPDRFGPGGSNSNGMQNAIVGEPLDQVDQDIASVSQHGYSEVTGAGQYNEAYTGYQVGTHHSIMDPTRPGAHLSEGLFMFGSTSRDHTNTSTDFMQDTPALMDPGQVNLADSPSQIDPEIQGFLDGFFMNNDGWDSSGFASGLRSFDFGGL